MMKFSQTANKVSQMMEIAFDVGSEVEKRETATSNLLVLAKENAGIVIINFDCLCYHFYLKTFLMQFKELKFWLRKVFFRRLVPYLK